MSRDQVLTDAQWALIEPLLPSSKGKRSRPFRDHRQVLEGIVFRYRTGCPWRDVPDRLLAATLAADDRVTVAADGAA